MAEIKHLAVAAICFAIFSIGLLSFIYTFQDVNDAGTKISNDASLNVLNSSINGLATNYHASRSSFDSAWKAPSIISFGWVIFNGVILLGQLLFFIPIQATNLIIRIPSTVLGINNPIIDLMTGLIVLAVFISTVILIIKFWRQGS